MQHADMSLEEQSGVHDKGEASSFHRKTPSNGMHEGATEQNRKEDGERKPQQTREGRSLRSLECMRKGILVSMAARAHPRRHFGARADKYIFPPRGSVPKEVGGCATPPHGLGASFEYKEYLPEDFSGLRLANGISELDFAASLSSYEEFKELSTNSKSGSMFFRSADGRYLIKTQHRSESKLIREIMPSYARYVRQNPDTLIIKYLGLYRVRLGQFGRKLHVVVMENVLRSCPHPDLLYDLKGSTVGRKVKTEGPDAESCRKDVNFMEDGMKLEMGEQKPAFLRQLRKDVQFLQELGILDYSLLVAVNKGLNDKKEYTMGIIDILQDWNFRKKTAQIVKSLRHEPAQLSTVHPSLYGPRFLAFIEAHTVVLESITPSKKSTSALKGVAADVRGRAARAHSLAWMSKSGQSILRAY